MMYRPVHCPLTNQSGHVCGAHLGDIEADVNVSFVLRCRQKHQDGEKKKILFTQNDSGTITHKESIEGADLIYAPDTIRYTS